MEIQKVANISYDEFMKEFCEPGIPVVFRNASRIWKANGMFTPDWFRKNFAARFIKKGGRNYTMKEIMHMVENSTDDNPAPYPFILKYFSKLPELLPLLQRLHVNYTLPNSLDSKWFQLEKRGGVTELYNGGLVESLPMCISIFMT